MKDNQLEKTIVLGASQSNHYRTITGSQDNGTSIKNENNWIEFYGADGMEGIIHPLNDDWMIGVYNLEVNEEQKMEAIIRME